MNSVHIDFQQEPDFSRINLSVRNMTLDKYSEILDFIRMFSSNQIIHLEQKINTDN